MAKNVYVTVSEAVASVNGKTGMVVIDKNDIGLGNINNDSMSVAAADINWLLGNVFYKTLSANTVFTFSNLIDGQTIIVAVTNTASNYTVTWPTVSWSGGTAPTQTIGVKTDVYTFVKIGPTIYGAVIQNF